MHPKRHDAASYSQLQRCGHMRRMFQIQTNLFFTYGKMARTQLQVRDQWPQAVVPLKKMGLPKSKAQLQSWHGTNGTTFRYGKNAYFSYGKSGRTPATKIPRPSVRTCSYKSLRPRAASSRALEPSYSKPMLNPRATCVNLFLDSMRRRPKRG